MIKRSGARSAAAESGPEGIACVDDVARAAILALQAYRQLRVPAARELGRTWLGFLTHMQDPDGRFTNFIIDRAGKEEPPWPHLVSRWALVDGTRPLGLAVGFRVTGDEQYLHMLERAHPTRTTNLKVTAIRAMALMEWYDCRPTDALQRRILHLCDRLVAAGPDYFRDRKGRDELYPWGYHQLLQVVARAGRVFSRIDYLTACEHTVDNAVEPLIAGGFGEIAPWRQAPRCVYDVSTLMLGLEELYTATRHERYRDLAGRAWIGCMAPIRRARRSTIANRPLRGRCDGQRVSANCGAESTIEAGFMELARRRLQSGESSRVHPRPE